MPRIFWECYYPFRLSECNGAHGEICVLFNFVLVIQLIFIFILILRLLEGHFKGVPIPPPKYPPSHPTNFTPKRSLRGMRFLRYESLCDVRLRGYWWLPLQPLFCIRAALDLSTSLRYGRDDRGLGEWLFPCLSFRPEKIFDFRSGEIFFTVFFCRRLRWISPLCFATVEMTGN